MIEHTDSATIVVDSIRCIDSLNIPNLYTESIQVVTSNQSVSEPIMIVMLFIVVLSLIVILSYIIKYHKILKTLKNSALEMEKTVAKNSKHTKEEIADNIKKVNNTIAENDRSLKELIVNNKRDISQKIIENSKKIEETTIENSKMINDTIVENSKKVKETLAENSKIIETISVTTESLKDESLKVESSISILLKASGCKTLLKNEINRISNMEKVFPTDILKVIKAIPANNKDDYSKTLNISNIDDAKRVVVVGDIHCDYTSLSTMLNRLIDDNSYDYINRGYIVFLGDYVDRGFNLMKTIYLILTLKNIMGDRCILLKGNHELMVYENEEVRSRVSPSETATYLNDNHIEDVDFCKQLIEYFTSLPIYCIVNSCKKQFLLVHGGICKDQFMNEGGFINTDGKIEFHIETHTDDKEIAINPERRKQLREMMLYSMMWGDPNEYKKKFQTASSRFEFGKLQFERFMSLCSLDVLLRSHEPEKNGIKEFYDGRLYTIFSSGGEGNKDSEYSDAESPSCVIKPKYIILDPESNISIKDIY